MHVGYQDVARLFCFHGGDREVLVFIFLSVLWVLNRLAVLSIIGGKFSYTTLTKNKDMWFSLLIFYFNMKC